MTDIADIREALRDPLISAYSASPHSKGSDHDA